MPVSFVWCRTITKKQSHGVCHDCDYDAVCMGVCLAVRYSITGNVCGENHYCDMSSEGAGIYHDIFNCYL